MPFTTTKQEGSMFSAISRFRAIVAAAALLLTTAPVFAALVTIAIGANIDTVSPYLGYGLTELGVNGAVIDTARTTATTSLGLIQ